jgi:hypothetical protein
MDNTVLCLKVTSFGPFYRPSSDLHTKIHERNYTIIYITLKEEISSFTKMYKTLL